MLAPWLLQAPISWAQKAGMGPDQKEESNVCFVHSTKAKGWPRSTPDGVWGTSFPGAPETSGLPALQFSPAL